MKFFRWSWVLWVVLLLPTDLLACSCGWSGPFLTVGPKQDLMVRGKVLRYSSNSMEVEVQEVLSGSLKTKVVRIWGDNGRLCRPYVTTFPVGSEWVFAVSNNKSEGDYAIGGCGEFAVQVDKDTVLGKLSSRNAETISLKTFRERLAANKP